VNGIVGGMGGIGEADEADDADEATGGRRPWITALVGLLVVAALAAGCSSNSSSSTTTSSSSSSSSSSVTATTLSTTAVRALQSALAKVGCYAGSIDGIGGPLTTAAVRAFQSAVKLPVDGIYGANTKFKLLAAVNAGAKVCSTTPSTTTTAASTSTTAASGSSTPSAAIAAINSYQTANGPTAGTWQISSTAVSTVDPSYVLFRIGPAPGHETTVQAGYGFVHDQGGAWTVIGFGSSEVGCPPGNSQNVLVPSAVLAGFGVSCPPT
jgi:peptidoglycan hydrolase-like protein with peptidoglycan-binding domain